MPLYLLLLAVCAAVSLHARSNTTAADFLVLSLPGLYANVPAEEIPVMFAGQLEVYSENTTYYFFWRFADQQPDAAAANTTIFWLNGGPGCLSMDGALMESGPFRIDGAGNVVYNRGLWHKKGTVVFVDQPANTGFSFSGTYAQELHQVKYAFLRFMERYFALFPEDRGNDIVLAGELYAGQYIPYIAQGILEHNRNGEPYSLQGLLIGNGWIDPATQGLLYLPYSYAAGVITPEHENWELVQAQHLMCQHSTDLDRGKLLYMDCENVLKAILAVTRRGPKSSQCVNMYDHTLQDLYPACGMNWPPDVLRVSDFLRLEPVMGFLNLDNRREWEECRSSVSRHFAPRTSPPLITLFPELLAHMQIVLFHGNRDIICNYIGGEDMIKRLEWGSERGFADNTTVYDWVHNGTVEGYIKSERNLTFVNVFDALHMVPFDKPAALAALVDLLFGRYAVGPGLNETWAWLTAPERALAAAPALPPTSLRVVRLIELVAIVVLVWGACALYRMFQGPTSIIKTKPLGRKKVVQWADQMPEERKGLLAKAFGRLGKGYAPVSGGEDIELGQMAFEPGDDFVIGSDND